MTPLEEVEALLSLAQSETQYRTVTSRAYFAAYNLVVIVAESIGFEKTRGGDDHQRLINFLKMQRLDLLIRSGTRLGRLRNLRNRADYIQDLPFPKGVAEEAARTAEEIMRWMNMISPAKHEPPSE